LSATSLGNAGRSGLAGVPASPLTNRSVPVTMVLAPTARALALALIWRAPASGMNAPLVPRSASRPADRVLEPTRRLSPCSCPSVGLEE